MTTFYFKGIFQKFADFIQPRYDQSFKKEKTKQYDDSSRIKERYLT